MIMKSFMFFVLSIIVTGCLQNPVSPPPDIPVSQLLASPDTITLDGRKFYLTTYMWRDFQPISPPDGKPLIAICYITATDTTKLQGTITADAVWIVNNDKVWKSWFTNEPHTPDPSRKNRIEKIVRNGPKWGPHITVDVIVRISDKSGHSQLLRASDQWIGRTD